MADRPIRLLLDLEHSGRAEVGVYAHVAQRLLALAAIWHNWAAGKPDKLSLIA
jgi:hypothetical protein